MTTTKLCLAFAGALGLAACGGGGGGGGGGLTPAPQTFDTLRSDYNALLSAYDATPVTPLGAMPNSGSATYRGSAVYSSVDTDPNVIIANPTSTSAVEITANFATAAVGGRLHDFRSATPGSTMTGDLALANGFIQNNTMAADIVGSLTVDGVERDHTGGRLLGAFLGQNAGAVGGPILRGGSPTPYNGSFIAER
jgi:hypothetical protein